MDEAQEVEIRERLQEFKKEALTVADLVDEALGNFNDGSPELALTLISQAHNLEKYRDDIQRAFADAGVSPG